MASVAFYVSTERAHRLLPATVELCLLQRGSQLSLRLVAGASSRLGVDAADVCCFSHLSDRMDRPTPCLRHVVNPLPGVSTWRAGPLLLRGGSEHGWSSGHLSGQGPRICFRVRVCRQAGTARCVTSAGKWTRRMQWTKGENPVIFTGFYALIGARSSVLWFFKSCYS